MVTGIYFALMVTALIIITLSVFDVSKKKKRVMSQESLKPLTIENITAALKYHISKVSGGDEVNNSNDMLVSKKEEEKQDGLEPRQIAAYVLILFGIEKASKVIKGFSEYELQQITFEIARVEFLTKKMYSELKEDYGAINEETPDIIKGGIDYARDLLTHAFGIEEAMRIINSLTTSLNCRPFDLVRRINPKHLIGFLNKEHPQVIALVLSYLDSKDASYIMQNFENRSLAPDVAYRISTLKEVSPEVLREIERVIERMTSTITSEDYANAGGVLGLTNILYESPRDLERSVVEAIEEVDQEIASEIKSNFFVIEDVVLLDDKEVSLLLECVSNIEIAIAMKSIEPEVSKKILDSLSLYRKIIVKYYLKKVTGIRLLVVEEIQRKICLKAKELIEEGKIIFSTETTIVL